MKRINAIVITGAFATGVYQAIIGNNEAALVCIVSAIFPSMPKIDVE